MLDRKKCEAFIAVVQTGSFEQAAKSLCLTASAVTTRVGSLERELGHVLIQRGKPCSPTKVGSLLLEHIQHVKLQETSLMQEINRGTSDSFYPLVIASNADSLATWLLPAIHNFIINQNISLEILIDDQSQTHHLMSSGMVNACISIESNPMKGCEANYLGTMNYKLFATRQFINRWFAEGMTRNEFSNAPAVIFNDKDYLHFDVLTNSFGLPKGSYPYHLIPSSDTFLTAIKHGLGYGFLPTLQIPSEPSNIGLINIASDIEVDINLYWHHWKNESDVLQRFSSNIISNGRKLMHVNSKLI